MLVVGLPWWLNGSSSLPVNSGDTALIPGLGRFHVPQGNEACVPQLLSPCSRALEPKLLSPCAATAEACSPRAYASRTRKATSVRSPCPATKCSSHLLQSEKVCVQ